MHVIKYLSGYTLPNFIQYVLQTNDVSSFIRHSQLFHQHFSLTTADSGQTEHW